MIDPMIAFLTWIAPQELLLTALLVGLGATLGRWRWGDVSLGAAAVLFLAMGVSAWAQAQGQPLHVPEPLGALGLVLFTFCVGMMAGPDFGSALRQGWAPVLAMVAALLLAAGVAVLGGRLLGLDAATVAGAFAGAVTNTPALAAAREAAGHSALPTVGYAVTYLFGVLGMLVAIQVALRRRAQDTDAPQPLLHCTVRVETAARPSLQALEQQHGGRVRFSRVSHGASQPPQVAGQEDTLRHNDLVTVVGPADAVAQVVAQLGHRSSHALEDDRHTLDFRRVTVSNHAAAGRPIAALDLVHRFGATVSRVRRGDVDLLAADTLVLQLGDRVRVVAPPGQMSAVTQFFGDSARGLSDVNPVALGGGLALGLLLGQWVLPGPGGGFVLGSAAGTLLAGLLLGRLRRVGRWVTTVPHTAAQVLSELGLLMFLAQAGSKAGALVGGAFASGAWWKIALLGAAITSVLALAMLLAMRHAFGMGATRLSGVLAGTQTQPAALAFANGHTGHDARVAQGYALVYPAAMITKVLLGQWLGGLVGG